MREISSQRLNETGPISFASQNGELYLYDGLSTPFSNDVIVLSEEHKQQIEDFASGAAENYTTEDTQAYNMFGIPTLVARVDCTIGKNGVMLPYEMEDSPSGQGITDIIHKSIGRAGIKDVILGHYEELLNSPPTVIISNERGHGTDDGLIVGDSKYINIGNVPEDLRINGPVIVKAIPGSKTSRDPYLQFQQQAVAPLVTEGDKTYAEKVGILTAVKSEDDLLVDLNGDLSSQVVKSRLGSMAMGISIYLSRSDRERYGKARTVTASRLKRDLSKYCEQNKGALVQEFLPPFQIVNSEDRTNAILRVFTLLSSESGVVSAEAVGGCYVARNEVLLHGASNAVSGAVLV
ncbi:hypothetical protein KC950_00605 [Candidatus Saccharibacteria bacterium]|nr:hypothetical protein [Candidatus Saccharibacteria bacterium]